MRRADAVLFTGAGFSRGAKNRAGSSMPLGADLCPLIWSLCYPSEPFDGLSKLEDLFQVAKAKNPQGLKTLLQRELSVSPEGIPEYYGGLFSLPWTRIYTLNIDDLAVAADSRFKLPRKPLVISAISWAKRDLPEDRSDTLEVFHLNGVLEEAPDGITFSPTQYAERLAGQEPLYAQCAADVLSLPIIFVGTPLDEAPLWQHVHMRRRGARTRREFRRQSYLVTPSLERARRDLLEREFHVKHIPMTTEEFAAELTALSADVLDEGFVLLRSAVRSRATVSDVPLAQDLASKSVPGASDYLLGRAPTFGDVRDGVAARRECDADIERRVRDQLAAKAGEREVVLVVGTAGSGKSTAAMRLALALSAPGNAVAWVDGSVEISPFDLKRSMYVAGQAAVLIIDDADRYGSDMAPILADILNAPQHPVIVATMRSGRGTDRLLDRADALKIPISEFVLPDLTNADIDTVLASLDRHNRLGVLKGLSKREQHDAFRKVANRQLIVAMLEATSGRRFEDLMIAEMHELELEPRTLYAIVAVASALRFGLARDELLLASGDASNATLAAIDGLQRRLLIVPDARGTLRVRHRVIADVLVRCLSSEGILAGIITGLAVAAASKVTSATRQTHPHYRRIRSLINHDWILSKIAISDARQMYEELEAYLHWDHHYWLQRGSFELEHGDLQLAENFLNQSFGIEPNDVSVQTEIGYLKLRLATSESSTSESRRLLAEGFDLLAHAITARRGLDPHQYHIYGRQGLDWVRRGDVTADERSRLLNEILKRVEEGRAAHPRNDALRELYVSIQNERLGVSES